MSSANSAGIARRPLLKGLLAAAGVLAAAVAAFEVPLPWAQRYPATPFDDLLALLPDRDDAIGVGRASPVRHEPAAVLAQRLRRRIAGRPLAQVLEADLAAARLAEVRGWVLPATLVELCTLAARSSR